MAVPDSLATLIDPLAVDDFLARYWGKERLLLSRNDAKRYAYLLTAADIDDLVRFGPWSFVVPDGVGPVQSQTVVRGTPSELPIAGTRPLELHELRTFYQQGKTILLNGLQLRLPSVAALGRGLEQALHCPVNVNMYLTPPEQRGFSPHFDDHD